MAAFLGFIDCMTYMREIGERRGGSRYWRKRNKFPMFDNKLKFLITISLTSQKADSFNQNLENSNAKQHSDHSFSE